MLLAQISITMRWHQYCAETQINQQHHCLTLCMLPRANVFQNFPEPFRHLTKRASIPQYACVSVCPHSTFNTILAWRCENATDTNALLIILRNHAFASSCKHKFEMKTHDRMCRTAAPSDRNVYGRTIIEIPQKAPRDNKDTHDWQKSVATEQRNGCA